MVYYLVSGIGIVLAVLIFAGCNSSKQEQRKSDNISGISLSQMHMNFGGCYNFYLRAEDGKVIFDAEVRITGEPYVIILESIEVDEDYFTRLKELDERYNITGYVASYKKKKLPFTVMDETKNTTIVYFTDGADKTADTGSYEDDLYNFFLEIALRYQAYSVAEKVN